MLMTDFVTQLISQIYAEFLFPATHVKHGDHLRI